MTLAQLPIPSRWPSISDALVPYIREADERIARFLDDIRSTATIAFVPSDFSLAAAALMHIRESHLAPGPRFLEWGAGYAVVAGLADALGFDAHAIEIDPVLVTAARALARDFDRHHAIAEGSFIPPGADHLADTAADHAWLALGGADGYEALGLDPDDFDVIYAYPWPGEERVIHRLFDHCAAAGAILVTYHGLEGVRINRKRPSRGRSRRR